MAKVDIQDGNLIITMEGAEKLWALKGEMTISLDDVLKASVDDDAWDNLPTLFEKRYGTNSPFFYGGTFVQDGENVFYDLKRKEDAVVIFLKDDKYKRLIIGVDDPQATVAFIEKQKSNCCIHRKAKKQLSQ